MARLIMLTISKQQDWKISVLILQKNEIA